MVNLREEYNDQFVENDWAHYLIVRVDQTKNKDENLARLLNSGIKKTQLIATISYLKLNFAVKYHAATEVLTPKKAGMTKTDLFNQLLAFVKTTLSHLCLKCKVAYYPYTDNRSDGDDEGVKCFLCSLPAHNTCIKPPDINSEEGLVFLCQECLLHKGKSVIVADDLVPKPKTQQQPVEEEHTGYTETESSSSDEDSETVTPQDQRDRKKKKHSLENHRASQDRDSQHREKKLCKFFARGMCKHGISGMRGGQCKFDHPQMCKPYQQYGNRGRYGCKGNCKLWHPKLCYNALDYGECFNERCKFWHIKGTIRKSDQNNQQTPHPQHQQIPQSSVTEHSHSNQPQPAARDYPSQPAQPKARSDDHFLGSLETRVDQIARKQAEFQNQMSHFMSQITRQMQTPRQWGLVA